MKKYLSFPIILLLITINSRCINLEQASKFSSNSLTGVRKFNDIDWTFKKSCLETCLLKDIKTLKVPSQCSCENFAKADDATLMINAVLSGYFGTLADLSNGKLGSYKFDDLATALKEGNFGTVEIKKEHVEAGNNIANKLSKLVTNGIKAKKMKEFITDSDKDINSLLSKLQFIVSENLKGTLKTKKERHKILVDQIIDDDKASTYEKRSAIIDYTEEIKLIDDKMAMLDTYSTTLEAIKKGHHDIALSKSNLKHADLKNLIVIYANQIQELVSEFNKFKS